MELEQLYYCYTKIMNCLILYSFGMCILCTIAHELGHYCSIKKMIKKHQSYFATDQIHKVKMFFYFNGSHFLGFTLSDIYIKLYHDRNQEDAQRIIKALAKAGFMAENIFFFVYSFIVGFLNFYTKNRYCLPLAVSVTAFIIVFLLHINDYLKSHDKLYYDHPEMFVYPPKSLLQELLPVLPAGIINWKCNLNKQAQKYKLTMKTKLLFLLVLLLTAIADFICFRSSC